MRMWWLLGWCREHPCPAQSAGSCAVVRLMAPAPPAGSTTAGVGTTAARSAAPGIEDRGAAAVTGVDSLGIIVEEVMGRAWTGRLPSPGDRPVDLLCAPGHGCRHEPTALAPVIRTRSRTSDGRADRKSVV